MKPLAFVALLLWFSRSCPAQAVKGSVNFPKLGQYVTTVRLTGQKKKVSGILFNLTDSSVVLAPTGGLKPKLRALFNQHGGTWPPANELRAVLPLRTFKYGEIQRISLHRRGAVARDLLIMTSLGALVGFLLGSDPPDDVVSFSAGQKAVAFGIVGGLAGVATDIATIENVNAQKQSVATEMQDRLRKYAIVEQLKKANVYKP